MELNHIARSSGRLSHILKAEMHISTGLMNRLKWQDRILVNGQSQHTDYAVQAGDTVALLLDAPEPDYPAEDGPLTVLYEDDFLLAVDKPAGMLIHPSRAVVTGTLANRVQGYYHRTGQHCAFHPVTRLDRDTFGIVLAAKNPHIHARMNELHAAGAMEKRYHAWVYGGPAETAGVIDAPIARKPLPSLLREIRPDGKPSRTEFSLLERRGPVSKLSLRPITGRTHQLRLHCAYAGFPILGDPQYGSADARSYSAILGLTGQVLCAYELVFPHPVTGEMLRLFSKMDPADPTGTKNDEEI